MENSSKALRKQLTGFGIAGLGALLLDLLVFNTFLFSGASATVSNIAATITALIFKFVISSIAFSEKPSQIGSGRSILRFGLVSIASSAYILLGFEIFNMLAPESSKTTMTTARVLLIVSSSAARFFLYRGWVFSKGLKGSPSNRHGN